MLDGKWNPYEMEKDRHSGDSHVETQQQTRYFTGGCDHLESWLDKQSEVEADSKYFCGLHSSAAVCFCCLVTYIDTPNPTRA